LRCNFLGFLLPLARSEAGFLIAGGHNNK
jgi:hypothetical protein